MKRILIVLVFAVFAGGSIYGQEKREKPAVVSPVLFGKFTLGSTNECSANQIIKTDSLCVNPIGTEAPGKIVSYNVSTVKDGLGISETTYGSRLSKKQRVLISKVSPGDKLSIEKIVLKYPGKEKITLNAKITFKIKN